MQVGDWVEVKYDGAYTDSNGRPYATMIGVKGGASGSGGHDEGAYRELEGPATAVDATAHTFQLGGFTVVVDSATRYELADSYVNEAQFWSQLNEGDRVQVKGNEDANRDFLAAKIERSN